MTLKTEVMAVENVALPSQEYILFKNLFKYKTFSCNNILQYYCLCCIINQTNVDLVSMRESMKKILKTPNFCTHGKASLA